MILLKTVKVHKSQAWQSFAVAVHDAPWGLYPIYAVQCSMQFG